jgi:hypothetical protein
MNASATRRLTSERYRVTDKATRLTELGRQLCVPFFFGQRSQTIWTTMNCYASSMLSWIGTG